MRPIALAIVFPLVALACGWSKPAASPENSEEGESGDSKSSDSNKSDKSDTDVASSTNLEVASVPSGPAPAAKATVKDDPERKNAACKGAAIPDVLAAISQASCELPPNAPLAKLRASKEVLDIKTTAENPKIAPGSTGHVVVVYTNKSKEPLALDFTIDPDPHFAFELYTLKGSRMDKPAGPEPSLPDLGDPPDTRTARIVLAPNGKATLTLPWPAVRYRWAPKEKAKGALPGHGYPREPAGPLPRGKYILKVIVPLTDTDETDEHELSRTKVDIEIAGNPEAPPPPPVAAAPPPPKKEPAPASAPPSDATIEQKFLKATGGSAKPDEKAAPKKK